MEIEIVRRLTIGDITSFVWCCVYPTFLCTLSSQGKLRGQEDLNMGVEVFLCKLPTAIHLCSILSASVAGRSTMNA